MVQKFHTHTRFLILILILSPRPPIPASSHFPIRAYTLPRFRLLEIRARKILKFVGNLPII